MKRRQRFWFLVTCADFEPWIEACLESIDAQDHDELGLLIALDGPRDRSRQIVEACASRFEGIRDVRLHVHEERRGKAQRVVELMEELRFRPHDIVAFLDGDDRLIHPQAARRMEREFERGADVAWSNFIYKLPRSEGLAGRAGLCRAIPEGFDPYASEYVTSHLFCFRAADFFTIEPTNFDDAEGRRFRRGCDQCFTLPLLARSSRRVHVPEYFVEYNNQTPWQNDSDGAAAANAVEVVRARGLLRGDVTRRARAIAEAMAAQLAESQLSSGDFCQPSHYGVACACAAWLHLDRERFATQIIRAARFVASRQHAASRDAQAWPGYHWEFELLASTSVGAPDDAMRRVDNTRVLNWQLLLALVDRRLGRPLRYDILERVDANLTDAGLTDFDLRESRDLALSDQYHAFSSYLLDELRRVDAEPRIAELSDRCAAIVLANARRGDVNSRGRGRAQIFGYAAAFRVLVARGENEVAHDVLDRLEAARWAPGLFPLCLEDKERHFGMQAGWHGYNRYFDYAAFACMLLAELAAREASEPQVAARVATAGR